jgi:hypothetical protein
VYLLALQIPELISFSHAFCKLLFLSTLSQSGLDIEITKQLTFFDAL